MKSKLLRQVIDMSKLTLYGLAIQCVIYGALIASDLNAQNSDKSIQDIYIKMDETNAPLWQVLNKIEKETGFVFAYNIDKVNLNRQIAIHSGEMDLASVLMEISRESNLKFKRVNNNIHIGLRKKNDSLKIEERINEQQRTITGRVISSEDNSGLPGVNVIVQGTGMGTITDIEGNYAIQVSDGAILEFSSVGFNKEIIEVGSRTVIDISLMPDITQLSEIVVIGYGTREKKDLTGAISVMDAKDIVKSNAMSPDLAMQGQMAGVLVTTPSGNPQDRPNVQIRGVGTTNVASPLYVIDGIPITEYGSGYEGLVDARVRDLRGPVNVLTLINPQDIESISVLKDASAAAIYGVRAANGVILITTKKGKQGAAKVDYSLRYGVKNIPNRLNLLGVEDYTALYQEAHLNNPSTLGIMPLVFNPSDTVARGPYQDFLGNRPTIDWQSPMFNENAALVDHSLKVYGGNEGVDYFVSGGYSFQEGPMINNFMERYSLSTNINGRAGKHFEAGTTLRLSYVETRNQSPSLTQSVSAPPWQPLYAKDDYYSANIPQVVNNYGYATAIDTTSSQNSNHPNWGGTGNPALTPIYNMDALIKYGTETEMNYLARSDRRLNDQNFQYYRGMGTVYAAVKFLDGFKLRGSYSFDWYYQRRNSWSSIHEDWFSITPGNFWDTGDRSGTTKGNYGERHVRNYNLTGEIALSYNKSFGDHNIDVILNFMDQRYGFEVINASSSQIVVDDPERRFVPDIGATLADAAFTGYDRFALQGYMARASYNYAGKYYFDATVRRDGSSRFAPDYRWGIFPSFAAAWRVSSENFMAGVTLLNDLKIRAGWGQLGNQETKPFAYLSTVGLEPAYSYGSGMGNGVGRTVFGARLPDFPTFDLSWETTTTGNFGFDAILLKNKMNVTVEYYQRNTDDILQSAGLAPTVGNEIDPILNIASVKNSGWEFQLGWNDKIGPVEYYVNGNFTTVKNEVIKVWNDQPLFTSQGRIEIGRPLNHIWGYQVGGIFQSEDEITAYQEVYNDQQTDKTNVRPGDMWFKDVHGAPTETELFYTTTPDSVVNDLDRTFIGNTIPTHFYGINLGASWKNFDISFFFQGIGGVDKYNGERAKGTDMNNQGINQWTDVLNRWTPSNRNVWNPNDKAGSLPRAARNDPASNNRFSDRYVEGAGFMRLRDLTLGYTVPPKALANTNWVERIRVYISGQNLWTVTKWTGLDPENDNSPIPVMWAGGLNVTF